MAIINMTDLSKINLNLLLALDALLTHCHVTRAANMLGISQAAMSASLKQLREIYQDSLLVRGQQSQMTLTPLAVSLQAPVQLALRQAQAVFSGPTKFDAQTSTRSFHVGMSDYIAFVLMPLLMQHINQYAPQLQIVQHPINHIDTITVFESGKLDLVIGSFPQAPAALMSQGLFSDSAVIVADKKHPIFNKKKLTLSAITQYPQVFVSLEGRENKNFIYEHLQAKDLNPHVALFTPHTLIALYSLPHTKLITHTVARLATPLLKPCGLALKSAPYKFPPYRAKQYWHAKMNDDAGHRWLRQLIQKLSSNAPG